MSKEWYSWQTKIIITIEYNIFAFVIKPIHQNVGNHLHKTIPLHNDKII